MIANQKRIHIPFRQNRKAEFVDFDASKCRSSEQFGKSFTWCYCRFGFKRRNKNLRLSLVFIYKILINSRL